MYRWSVRVSTIGRFLKATTKSPFLSPAAAAGVSFITSTISAPNPSRSPCFCEMSFISCSERSRMRTPSQPKRVAASVAPDAITIARRRMATSARDITLPSPRELVQEIVERHRQPLEPSLDVELLEESASYGGIGNHA